MKYRKSREPKSDKMRAEIDKRESKIPDMYKRDKSPEQNGEDF